MSSNNKFMAGNLPKFAVIGVAIAGVAILLSKAIGSGDDGAQVQVKLPSLTAAGESGKSLFDANCAACHGKNGAGTKQGPPLIHAIYRPGHHADQSFTFAAKYGVRSHHWRFGNMPAQPQVSEQDVQKIVGFVREVQRANGVQ